MSQIELNLIDDLLPADRATIIGGLIAFNDARASLEHYRELAIVARSEGAVIGGLLGQTNWNWLFIRQLWVSEAFRGSGVGRRLVEAAEAEAARRGCAHAHCDTFEFQALPFYEKLGYEVFGQLEDYPPGFSRFFLRKLLLVTASGR